MTTASDGKIGTETARVPEVAGATIQPGARIYFGRILTVALVLRLALVAIELSENPRGWLFRSQGELGNLAQSLLAGHGMSSPFGGSTGPTAFLAPGYPAVIAAIFAVFGTFTTASAIAVTLMQTAFCVLTIFLIMKVAEQEFGPLGANVSGIFWAVGLPYLFLPVVFWDTSLTLLLVISAVALTLRCARSPTPLNWAMMGVFGAGTMLVNPSLLLVLAALFGWAMYQARSRAGFGPVIGVVVLLAIFAPWPIRNERVLHAFIPLRSNLGFELWKGNRPGATALDDPNLYPVFNRPEFDSYAAKGEVVFMRDKAALAKQYILSHPAEFLRLSAKRFFCYWTGMGQESMVLVGFTCLTTILAALGLVWLAKDGRGSLALMFALPLLLFPLPYYITHAELRFRLTLEPIATLLSTYAVIQMADYFKRRRAAG